MDYTIDQLCLGGIFVISYIYRKKGDYGVL